MRSALFHQHRRGREQLLRAGVRTQEVLEVARAADAQAVILRLASNQRAMLQLWEAESCARVLPEEGQGTERVVREAAAAKRQRDIDIWEAR